MSDTICGWSASDIYDGLTAAQVAQVKLHRRLYGTAIVERMPDGTRRVIDPQTVAVTADGLRRLGSGAVARFRRVYLLTDPMEPSRVQIATIGEWLGRVSAWETAHELDGASAHLAAAVVRDLARLTSLDDVPCIGPTVMVGRIEEVTGQAAELLGLWASDSEARRP